MLVMGTDDCNGHSNKVTSSGSTSQSTSCSSISPENPSYGSVIADSLPEITEDLGPKFRILRRTDQIHELQTKLRNVETSRSEFKFVADRLIRMVIEEGLNQLRKYRNLGIEVPPWRYLYLGISIHCAWQRSMVKELIYLNGQFYVRLRTMNIDPNSNLT